MEGHGRQWKVMEGHRMSLKVFSYHQIDIQSEKSMDDIVQSAMLVVMVDMVTEGLGRSWEIREGHGKLWKVMKGHRGSFSIIRLTF